jgi:hypothetical protein
MGNSLENWTQIGGCVLFSSLISGILQGCSSYFQRMDSIPLLLFAISSSS